VGQKFELTIESGSRQPDGATRSASSGERARPLSAGPGACFKAFVLCRPQTGAAPG